MNVYFDLFFVFCGFVTALWFFNCAGNLRVIRLKREEIEKAMKPQQSLFKKVK